MSPDEGRKATDPTIEATERMRILATSETSIVEVVEELRRMKDHGLERAVALECLERLRDDAALEAEEDRILEIMDVVGGFCSPQMRVWQ
jgi:hypothetical protein